VTQPLPPGQARFAEFVAILGRGPRKSRALTREEAREAFALVLRGVVDPVQLGAFLMLLRYRGEDADEIAGLVEAAREAAGLPAPLGAALDWPSYGAGRTRGAPWFLLAALALARAGVPVLMHGTNRFSGGVGVPEALAALGLESAGSLADAERQIAQARFAYLPLDRILPALDRLLGLRGLLGLRSPVNTVVRLLDPAGAGAGVDGVFHPAYLAVHLGVAERLGRKRLLVLKGGGGEAERNPAKAAVGHLWDVNSGRAEVVFPVLSAALPEHGDAALLAAVWRGEARPACAVATVQATLGLALLALGWAATPEDADAQAAALWDARGSAAGGAERGTKLLVRIGGR
jgi:anthranilate phosphoribosyltransferase